MAWASDSAPALAPAEAALLAGLLAGLLAEQRHQLLDPAEPSEAAAHPITGSGVAA